MNPPTRWAMNTPIRCQVPLPEILPARLALGGGHRYRWDLLLTNSLPQVQGARVDPQGRLLEEAPGQGDRRQGQPIPLWGQLRAWPAGCAHPQQGPWPELELTFSDGRLVGVAPVIPPEGPLVTTTARPGDGEPPEPGAALAVTPRPGPGPGTAAACATC